MNSGVPGNGGFQDESSKTVRGHPSVGWVSPIDGTVSVEGRLVDVHAGGTDGVGYWLQHFKADMASLQKSAGRTKKMRELADEKAKLLLDADEVQLLFCGLAVQYSQTFAW